MISADDEETKLPGIRVGAPAKVTLMSGGEPLKARVQSISRGITDRNAAPDAQLLANGPSEKALVPSPLMNAMRLGKIARIEELTRIPADVHFYPLPERVVTIYPQWRGYDFILVGGRYIIVQPETHEIVYIIEG